MQDRDSLVRNNMHCTATLVISGVIKIMVVEINFKKKNIWIVFGCNKQHFIYLFDLSLHLIYFMTSSGTESWSTNHLEIF